MPIEPAEALTSVLAGAALVGLAWLALGVLLVLLSMMPGVVGHATQQVSGAVTPRVVRQAAGALLGVVVAAGAAPGASVAAPATTVVALRPPPDPSFTTLPEPGWAPLDDASAAPGAGWVPGPPLVRAQPDVRVLSPALRPGPGGDLPREVVVRGGDSLWSIAARHLGPDPSDAEIARAWPAWFAANRDVVGDDPDLLRPGQLLRPPDVVPS